MKSNLEPAPQGVLAGLVERVIFHNAESSSCVLRAKARGHRDIAPEQAWLTGEVRKASRPKRVCKAEDYAEPILRSVMARGSILIQSGCSP